MAIETLFSKQTRRAVAKRIFTWNVSLEGHTCANGDCIVAALLVEEFGSEWWQSTSGCGEDGMHFPPLGHVLEAFNAAGKPLSDEEENTIDGLMKLNDNGSLTEPGAVASALGVAATSEQEQA